MIVKLVHTSLEKGRQVARFETRLSDFRACPGGYVPRKVLHVAEAIQPPVGVTYWESNDLGDVAPQDDDFVIKIAATTDVIGLENPPPVGAVRSLDITKLTKDDLAKVPKTIFGNPGTE